MPNKRKICTENLNSNQSIYIPSLNSYYPPESVINSAYRKVLDFKENAEKILEKEKSETLCLSEFSRAILESRSFEISLQHNCIKLKCYITLEKDKDAKKKRNEQVNSALTPPSTPTAFRRESISSNNDLDSLMTPTSPTFNKANPILANTPPNSSGGAKKVNVEVIMKSNPFRVEENEKTTRMELIRTSVADMNGGMLRFTYYVKPECEAKKFRDTNTDLFDSNGRLIVFTNDFFTICQDPGTGEMNISLNEIVQTVEEQRRTEALGEKLFTLLKDRPRHRALLTNECKLNHSFMNLQSPLVDGISAKSDYSAMNNNNQEDETYYTRELIHIYGQPIVPSFHKYFNYQLSNTHYGYRTLRRLLNCDILKKYVKITKEEIKSLDRVVEFVQLTHDKCLLAFQLNMTSFYDPIRFENGIVKNWLDVWYVDRLKEKYALNESSINKDFLCTSTTPTTASSSNTMSYSLPTTFSSSWSMVPQFSNESTSCFLHTTNCDHEESECDQANHLWFCLQDYTCLKMEEFMHKIKDYIFIKNNKSELILVHTAHPVFEYKDVLAETRRILAMFLSKSSCNKTLDEIIGNQLPRVAKEHVESLLVKFLNIDEDSKKIIGFTALFEILMILKRELAKEKNDEMKYSHFLCTLERANQEKLKLAIIQLKCVPCLNKFTTNFNIINTTTGTNNTNSLMSSQMNQMSSSPSNSNLNSSTNNANGKNVVSHANMSRLLKQMSLIVSTELQQIAIDVFEKMEEDKLVKYIKLKEEFRHTSSQLQQQQQQISQAASKQSQQQTSNAIQSQTKSQPIPVQSNSSSTNSSNKKQTNDRQIRSLTASFSKQMDITSSSSSSNSTSSSTRLPIFNPNSLLNYFNADQKAQELNMDRTNTSNNLMYSERS